MCLTIPSEQEVYKFYRFGEYQQTGKGYWTMRSPYMGSWLIVKLNTVIKSNRTSRNLTIAELRSGRVDYGLHVFLSAKDATKAAMQYFDNTQDFIIVKLRGALRDFVACGNYDKCDSAVYTKLKIVDVVTYRKNGKFVKQIPMSIHYVPNNSTKTRI